MSALAAMPTSILSDCLDRLNVLDAALRPLSPPYPSAGSAFTVEEIEGGNLMSHLALQYVQPGDGAGDRREGRDHAGLWGGLQTFAAQRKAWRRSSSTARPRRRGKHEYDVPVCKAVTPAGPHNGWGGRVNQPIACGSTVVRSGDVGVGDGDGIVVVPRELAAETW